MHSLCLPASYLQAPQWTPAQRPGLPQPPPPQRLQQPPPNGGGQFQQQQPIRITQPLGMGGGMGRGMGRGGLLEVRHAFVPEEALQESGPTRREAPPRPPEHSDPEAVLTWL